MSQPPSPARLLPVGLRVLRLSADQEAIALLTEPEAEFARCPLCGRSSKRVHSRYFRTLSDLPLGEAVRQRRGAGPEAPRAPR